MGLAIRRLTEADWQKAQENVALFWENTASPETIKKFLQDSSNIFLSAEIGNEPVGQLIGYLLDRWDIDKPMLFLYSIDVAARHQRKGIGKALIETLKNLGTELHCSEIFVLTNEDNLPAMQLFQATGGQRENPDDVLFVYELNQ